jgi:hypothetical protein
MDFGGDSDLNMKDTDDVVESQTSTFSQEKIDTCIQVLEALQLDPNTFSSPALKPLRKCLANLALKYPKTFCPGASDSNAARKESLQLLNRQRQRQQAHDRRFINNTLLREGRLKRLEEHRKGSLQHDGLKLMIPDGVSLDQPPTSLLCGPAPEAGGTAPLLERPRSCYICKARFRELHFFYDQLCPACAELNYTKRHHTADLRGKVAVVTGARVKIGYQVQQRRSPFERSIFQSTRIGSASSSTAASAAACARARSNAPAGTDRPAPGPARAVTAAARAARAAPRRWC